MNKNDLRDAYNKIAQDFADEHNNDDWDDDYIGYFIDLLKPKSWVLDLGCGAGNDAYTLSQHDLAVVGVDLSDELIKIAKSKYPGITFQQGDMYQLPCADNQFAGVFAKASLLHIPKADMLKVVTEVGRVLETDGRLHIAIKGGEGEGILHEDDYGYEYSRFFSYWSMDNFCDVLASVGFEVMRKDIWRRTPESNTTWLKILAKKSK